MATQENNIQDPQMVTEVTETPEECCSQEQAPDSASLELGEVKNQLLRLAAEYDNFRKRTQREREQLHGDVRSDAVACFLPILDNLDRAVEAPTTDTAFQQGIELINKQFRDVLSKMGVLEIDSLGKPFDPLWHNAVMHVEQEETGPSTIVEVFQKGYHMGDRVIRHAVVKVAN